MTISDRIFQPFENLVKPLDLPIRPMPDSGPIALLWHFALMFRAVLGFVCVLSILSASLALFIIWSLSFIVDGVVAQGALTFLTENAALLIVFALIVTLGSPTLTFLEESVNGLSARILLPAAMRWQAYNAVEGQDVAFFEDTFAGQVASRIAQVTGSVQSQMMLAVTTVPRFIVQFGGSLALLLALAWPLAIPVLFWMLANALLAWRVVPAYISRSSRVAAASSRATGAMTDIYSNITTVKLFAAEDSEAGAVRTVMQDTIDTQHREQRIYIVSNTLVIAFNALLIVSTFGMGLWGMLNGFVSVGDFVAAAVITRQLSNTAFVFIGLGQQISRTLGTIKDAMPIMTQRPAIVDKPGAEDLDVEDARISIENINFTYVKSTTPDEDDTGEDSGDDAGDDSRDDSRDAKTAAKAGDEKSSTVDLSKKSDAAQDAPVMVIKDLSLTVEAGERVGLVGVSGSGKSTLISLLLRLREPDSGSIRIDDTDIRSVTQASLRSQIGVVTQDIALFNRSVRDNIRYGAPLASDTDIRRALEQAEASEFIKQLHDKEGRTGLDAHVGERGVKLSGGQRQRLSIARVILKNAPILLLDEATSALDSEAEAAIQSNLETLMENRTTLAIAHRLSTIAAMDRLVVMDHGRIVESGTHRELLENDGLYARLWNRQSGDFVGVDIEAEEV